MIIEALHETHNLQNEIVGGTLPNGRNGHIGGGLGLKNHSHPMRLPHTYVYTILHLTLHPPQNVGTLRKVTHVYEQSSLYDQGGLVVT